MDAAEEATYWDEWGQYIDGYGVYDEQGNYVYPEAAVEGVAGGQPQSPGVGVDPSWYASGEPFGDDVTAGDAASAAAATASATAEFAELDGWEQMYDDDGHAYYFNHHTSDWQYEEPAGFARHRVAAAAAAPGEPGYWDEHGEYHWQAVEEGGADAAASGAGGAASSAAANPPAEFID